MLKIELKPFEMTDLSIILANPIRFVSLEFSDSKINYCNLIFACKRNPYMRGIIVGFKGKYFQSSTILLPLDTHIMNLTQYDHCHLQTEESPIHIGMGLHLSEKKILMRYAHI